MFAPLLRKMNAVFAPSVVRVFGNFYVPFLGAGIRITKIDPDFRYIRVEMPLRAFNRNYVGMLEREEYAASIDMLEKLALALDIDPIEFLRADT